MEVLFVIIVLVIMYVYMVYPLLLILLSYLKKTDTVDKTGIFPFVTILITAYNEEDIIGKKLDNTLQLDYPKDKLEIIVVSDGSTDNTNRIVREYEGKGVKLNIIEKRAGKTAAQNDSVVKAGGEIIVFSDANGMYERDAVSKLAGNFRDEKTGCVCGELLYTDARGDTAGKGENLYWRYERFLKKKESELGSVLGAAGSIYAVRKELYVPLDESLISDFLEPLKVREKGYRVSYEPEAISREETSASIGDEFKRKVRIITRGIFGLFAVKNLLNPFKYGLFSIQLISHKLLRWLIPIFMVFLFILNILLLDKKMFIIIFYCQMMFYAFSFVGYLLEGKKVKARVFFMPLYFCMVNLAALSGWCNFIRGRKNILWETRERQ